MTVRHEHGDLFRSGLPALAHGCNTQGAMGAGIAKEFRRRWPEMYEAYRERCRAGEFRLGGVFVWGTDPVIFNLATQPRPGPSATLDAIASAVQAMLDSAADLGIAKIGLPRLGAGLGGLDWSKVADCLDRVAGQSDIELIVYTLEPAADA